MLVDAHCHAGTGDGLTGPWDTRASLTAYERRARAAGIDRTVLLACFTSDYRLANREVGALVRARPDRYWGFAFVHGQRDRHRVGDLVDEAVRDWGARGIKLHGLDGAISREVCEVAAVRGLPVLYDVAGRTDPLRLVATEYPQVDFVIPHLGSFADDWAAQCRVIDLLGRHPNLYVDTSGVRRFDLLVEALRAVGPTRVLFGSDGPWLHPGLELAKIHLLGLSPRDEALVTGGNALRLMRLGPPGRARTRTTPAPRGAVPPTPAGTPSASGRPPSGRRRPSPRPSPRPASPRPA